MKRNPIELVIKFKSLVAETIIIKQHEYQCLKRRYFVPDLKKKHKALKEYNNIHQHRILVVRKEARATHLARAFLRGRPYKKIEPICYEEPDWAKVEYMILRYGGMNEREARTKFSEWSAVSTLIIGPGKYKKKDIKPPKDRRLHLA